MAMTLPVEVIAHIMRFLNVSDRKEASLVCKQWYEASLDPALQCDVTLSFLSTSLPSHSLAQRRAHLALNHVDNLGASKSAILKCCRSMGDSLESISLRGSDITEGVFVQLISACPALTSLDLTSCNALMMSGKFLESSEDVQLLRETLVNLKELSLGSNRYLSDTIFNRIMSVCPNVEKLSLASCQITFHSHSYLSRNRGSASSSVLTFENFISFLERNASRIKSLDLSRTPLNNKGLKRVAQVKGLELRELRLVSCREVSDAGLLELSRTQPGLEVLDLASCIDVTDATLATVATSLRHIRILKMDKCKQVTNAGVKMLRGSTSLACVSLAECFQLTSEGLVAGLCSSIQSSLTHLNLNCCSGITDRFVLELTKCVPGLLHLDLGSCFPLTNLAVHAISKQLKGLRFLRLAWCKQISDLGLLGLEGEQDLTGLPHAEHGDHGQCRCTRQYNSVTPIFKKPAGSSKDKKLLTASDVESLLASRPDIYRLSNLARLRTLDLSSCPKLTDLGMREGVRFLELQRLLLNSDYGITDAGLIAIACSNPSLEEVQLQQCASLTDASIRVLVEKCPRLTCLDLASCDRLTDKTLQHIQVNCRRLRHLDVSFCSGLTLSAVEYLEANLKSLKSLHKRNVGDSI